MKKILFTKKQKRIFGFVGLVILGVLAIVVLFVLPIVSQEPAVPCGGLTFSWVNAGFKECTEDGTIVLQDPDGNLLYMGITYSEKIFLGETSKVVVSSWARTPDGTIPFTMHCSIQSFSRGGVTYSDSSIFVDDYTYTTDGNGLTLLEKLESNTEYGVSCEGENNVDVSTSFEVDVLP